MTVPEGFAPTSATFISDQTGWVLGTAPCDTDPDGCGLIVRTRDAGSTWRAVSSLGPGSAAGGELRFANERDGFLLDGGLSVSHDGGATWQLVDTLAQGIHEADQVEAAHGSVWVSGGCEHCERGIWHAPVSGGTFQSSLQGVESGVPLEIVLHGSTVSVMAFPDGIPGRTEWRIALTGRSLVRRALPCAPGESGGIAMRTSTTYLLACLGDSAAGAQDTKAFLTHDAGRTWRRLADPEQLAGARPLVTSDALFLASNRAVQVSRDAGRTWSRVLETTGCGPLCGYQEVGFESSRLGFLIERHRQGSVMHLSHDDGRSWRAVDFRRTASS